MSEFTRKEEIKEIFYLFEKPGASFFGRLVKVDSVTYQKDKPAQKEYLFQPWKDSSMAEEVLTDVKVRGTAILDRLMPQVKVNSWVEIFYIGEEAKGGGNRMKKFQIYKVNRIVSREPGDEAEFGPA